MSFLTQSDMYGTFTGPSVKLADLRSSGALAAYTRTGDVILADANGALGTIDGVATAVGQRFFLHPSDAAAGADVGIYEIDSIGGASAKYQMTRASDCNTNVEFGPNTIIQVKAGTAYAQCAYQITNDAVTLNTTAITVQQIPFGFGVVGSMTAPSLQQAASAGTSVLATPIDHAHATPIYVDAWTNPAAADTNAIKTSIASSASPASYSGADLNGVVGVGAMSPPRNITITTSSHADIDAVVVVVTGTDIDDNALVENITLTDNGGVTDAGVKAFKTVSQIDVPAQSGTGGTLEFGFGTSIGLTKKAKTRAGMLVALQEIEAGSVVATGTFGLAATALPYGTYTPNTAADGANDYVLAYEVDYS